MSHWCCEAAMAKATGLFRELNPGPLAPEARIMPLDQTARFDISFSATCNLRIFLRVRVSVSVCTRAAREDTQMSRQIDQVDPFAHIRARSASIARRRCRDAASAEVEKCGAARSGVAQALSPASAPPPLRSSRALPTSAPPLPLRPPRARLGSAAAPPPGCLPRRHRRQLAPASRFFLPGFFDTFAIPLLPSGGPFCSVRTP